jgi:predicted acetyltransferase
MREIRPLTNHELEDYITIQLNAYPGIRMTREQLRERTARTQADPIISLVGLFEEGQLWGVMRLFDFTMQLHGAQLLVGGVGGVAVALDHKKEKVAYDMVQFFLHHYREKGASLTALYPFRADFYKQMGFGYGRKLNQYRFHPNQLPKRGTKANVTLLSSRDRYAFNACYQRVMAFTNGMMENSPSYLDAIFTSDNLRTAGCWEGDELRGYVQFQFEPGQHRNLLSNQLVVRALVYEETAVLYDLLAFLRSQADQIESIVLNTHDDDFHLLLTDPRNTGDLIFPTVYQESNIQGTGIMYRLVDVPRFFELLSHHSFDGQTCRLKVKMTDSFLPENGGEWVLDVVNGRVQLLPADAAHDVTLTLDVAEFSSLVTGSVELKTMLGYGLVELSDVAYAEIIHRLFYTDNKPVCLTGF